MECLRLVAAIQMQLDLKMSQLGKSMESDCPGALAAAAQQWYCIKTQPRRECVAVNALTQYNQISVYLPQIRVQRVFNRKPRWCLQPLFPGYLFARFDLTQDHRLVRYADGVSQIVHFGDRVPVLAPSIIADLQRELSQALPPRALPVLKVGEELTLGTGPLQGFTGKVVRLDKAQARVTMLLEMLGQQCWVEVAWSDLRGAAGNGYTFQ
jgi:transcriptional antiterminator RfaH